MTVQKSGVELELHKNAGDQVAKLAETYSTFLIAQGRANAVADNADVVSANHIKAAHEAFIARKRKRAFKEFMKVISSLVLGIVVKEIASGAASGPAHTLSVPVGYALAGIVAAMVLVWSIREQ